MIVEGMSMRETSLALGLGPQAVATWKRWDPEFQEMLDAADEEAARIVAQEMRENVRNEIEQLGPRAVERLKEALEHPDTRVALQAVGLVMRHGGPGEQVGVRLSVESLLARADASPAAGD